MPGSDGRLLHGQEYDKEGNLLVPFTQRMHDNEGADALVGQARTDINPVDMNASLVRVYDAANVSGVYLRFPGTINLQLPDVLQGITITYNSSSGNGDDVRDIGTVQWFGTSGGMNLNPVARAQASANIQPDLSFDIKQVWSQNVPVEHIVFYLSGTVTTTQVLAQLRVILTAAVTSIVAGTVTTTAAHGMAVGQPFQFVSLVGAAGGVVIDTTYYVVAVGSTTTFTYSTTPGGFAQIGHSATSGTFAPNVLTWPVFRPIAHTFTLKGQQISLSQNAESVLQYRWSADGLSFVISPWFGTRSDGTSREVGTSIRSIRVPPTIHGAITITTASQTEQATTTVKADIPQVIGINGGPSFAGLDNHPVPQTGTVTASVTPTTISATSPSAIPTAGLYLAEVNGSPFRYGLTRFHVVLVDFSFFA